MCVCNNDGQWQQQQQIYKNDDNWTRICKVWDDIDDMIVNDGRYRHTHTNTNTYIWQNRRTTRIGFYCHCKLIQSNREYLMCGNRVYFFSKNEFSIFLNQSECEKMCWVSMCGKWNHLLLHGLFVYFSLSFFHSLNHHPHSVCLCSHSQ